MKKWIALVLALVLCLSLTACGKSSSSTSSSDDTSTASAGSSTDTDTDTDADTSEEESSAEETDLASLTYAVEAGSAGEAAAQDQGWNYNSVASQADALMEVAAGTS
ncbi:MAG: hypothetical protein LUI02_05345, partial [Clostridiales bacterium]|nr:hypothetical protein [Clostridiales bacterium]